LTQATFDLYWIAVDPAAQGCGIGRALLAQVEEVVCTRGGQLLLIETSDLPAYASARRLYRRCGYLCEAIVHDFYGPGDSLLIFSKHLMSTRLSLEPVSDFQLADTPLALGA
jgi:ribosomal protein S18 acetylase RimI-like enzyme